MSSKIPGVARKPGGRAKLADQNDDLILKAAKEVFVENPEAPIAAVAARAGVGMAALYRRYSSKDNLLATLCADGQRTYIATAQAMLADPGPVWEAYERFLRRVVADDTLSLSSRLAGTFRPTEVHGTLAVQQRALDEQIFRRVKASKQMRPDVTFLDVVFMLEAIAQVRLGDGGRTAELRQRLLTLVLDSLKAGATTPLPGKAPTWEEQERRWVFVEPSR